MNASKVCLVSTIAIALLCSGCTAPFRQQVKVLNPSSQHKDIICTSKYFHKVFPGLSESAIGVYIDASKTSFIIVDDVDAWTKRIYIEHCVLYHENLHDADFNFNGNGWMTLYNKIPDRDTHHYGQLQTPLEDRLR